jgi:hypothetical protein
MRIKHAIAFCILLLCNILAADLVDFYKKDAIKLTPAPYFGKSIKWESLFFDTNKDLAVAPDGSIFVSNSSRHNIFKFSKNGEFLGKFSQKGQGPGDTSQPGKLSILDGKYLVVGERATLRRISLFDLSGKYVKIIRTNHSAFSPIALKNNKIAYLTYKYPGMKKKSSFKGLTKQTKVIIKNVEAGEEKVIDSIDIPDKSWIKLEKGSGVIRLDNYIGNVMIAKTKNGNLLVGASNSPVIKIYSLNGKLMHTFRLNMTPVPVTSNYVRKYKAYKVGYLSAAEGQKGRSDRRMAKVLKKYPFENLFADHLPYYKKISVDFQGNILVFKWTDCISDCDHIFQVYSPEGKYVCETRIDEGEFDFESSRFRNNIIFTDKGIFGLFQLKNSEDVSLRLVKVNID